MGLLVVAFGGDIGKYCNNTGVTVLVLTQHMWSWQRVRLIKIRALRGVVWQNFTGSTAFWIM